MRFITEFALSELQIKHARDQSVEYHKSICDRKIGTMISESFEWNNRDISRTIQANDNNAHSEIKMGETFTLEIEAFPMDKWVEFKQKVFSEMLEMGPMFSGVRMLELIKELESFGKPATSTP